MSILEEPGQHAYSQENQNFKEKAIAEIESFLFFSHKWSIPAILTIYVTFIIVNMKFLKHRRPLELKFPMLVYNVIQVFLNLYLFCCILRSDHARYILKHGCRPMDPGQNDIWLKGSFMARYFFTLKVIDLTDTVFIVLRKRESQITFLHLYHHIGMVVFSWYGIKFLIGEQLYIVAALNPVVHIVMYSYYTLTIIDKSREKYLRWKKYVTMLQLGQFVLYILYMLILLAFGCPLPRSATLLVLGQSIIFFGLFKNFYSQRYRNESQTKSNLEKVE